LRDQKKPDNRPRDPQEVALEQFKHIAEVHHPQPLPDGVLAELDRILEAAEQEAVELLGT